MNRYYPSQVLKSGKVGHGAPRVQNEGNRNFALVQALRGIAAMWVVLFHASAAGHIESVKASLPGWLSYALFDFGHNGVAVFFALSGFVIAHSIRGACISVSYLGRFALRRAIRLDPPYWASIVFVIGMAWLSARTKGEAFDAPTLEQIAVHILYLPIILHQPLINSVFWTLTYEVQFYLTLVAGVALAQRIGNIVYVVMFFIALAWGTGVIASSPIDGLFVNLWHCFFLGVLAYWAKENRTALVALVFLVCALALSSATPFNLVSIATATLLWVSWEFGIIYRALAWRWLQFLGLVSYSLYLFHNPVTGAVAFLCVKLGVSDWLVLIATIGGSVIVASACWWLFERPSQRLARKVRLASTLPEAKGPVLL